MHTRNIPTRNYFILAIVAILTFVLLYVLVSYFEKRKEYENSTHVRMNFLSELKESELSNYLLDNPDTIIYISDSTDSNYASFENELKTLILNENLAKNIVYMDVYKLSSSFFQNWKQGMFASTVTLHQFIYPNVFVVRDRQVVSVLYTTDQERKPRDVIEYIKNELDSE